MNRDEAIERLAARCTPWDMIVIGGGATGLGIALDAATRGYETLLLERDDFAQATSSRSTKLLHGGVRYLRQGNLKLVMGALRERGRVLANAPHLSSEQPFVIPTYKRGESLYYGFGLGVYERLAGRASLGRSRRLDAGEIRRELPGLRSDNLRGGVLYHDGQFDDARLAVCLAASAWDHGATVINYCQVAGLLRAGGVGTPVAGVVARDRETGAEHEIPARVVINATGVFCDSIRRMAEPGAAAWVAPSQGAHIVLDRRFLPGRNALMVPKTDDGRVLFAIPWQDRLLVGTTDVPVEDAETEPRAQSAEIDFLLEHAGRYLQEAPRRQDVLSVFAGLRPLVRAGGRSSSALARDHLLREEGGLVSITGGKWTTYREMAEQAVDIAARAAHLPGRPCCTANLALHGATTENLPTPLRSYGSDAAAVQALAQSRPELTALLHTGLPYIGAEVVWAAQYEMARSVQDVLARRTRALLLDARASIEAAPVVASLLAGILGRDAAWQARELAAFTVFARSYLADASSAAG
ncbi:MAG: glycerol-3-phosphate dehydrogenase/oxidase [Thiobacillus sp.]